MTRSRPPYYAQTVANSFIAKANSNEQARLSPMKLLKLVYFAHGWYLALTDEPLIKDPVEAWQYGPVIPSLYRALKKYGSDNITEFLHTGSEPLCVPSSDIRTNALINEVWRSYGRLRAVRLSDITHMPGTPWYHVVHTIHGGKVPQGEDISTDLIKQYFVELRQKGAYVG